MESESSQNGWYMTVIHDDFSNAIMKIRWCSIDFQENEKVQHTKEESDVALHF